MHARNSIHLFVCAFAALAFAAVLPSCGETHEDIIEDATGLMDDMTREVKSIQDAETAKTAEKNLNKIIDELADLAKRAKKLDEPSKEKQKEFDKKIQTATTAFTNAMMEAGTDPKRVEHVRDVMMSIGQKMQKIDFGQKK